MINELVIPIVQGLVGLLGSTGLLLLLKSHINKSVIVPARLKVEQLELQVQEAFGKAHDRIEESTNTLASHVEDKVRSCETAVIGHLESHAEGLVQSVEDLKAHARLVMDTTAARVNSAVVQRVTCPICNRVVHAFELNEDRSVKHCMDCKHRGQV